jgi:tRNA (cmo5U34)-methyltransferase
MPNDDQMRTMLASFKDPETARRYGDGPRRFMPGMDDLHRMTAILLAERAPEDGRVLVLGAGGGLELRALAQAHPGWTFLGVSADLILDQNHRFQFASRRVPILWI